MNTDALTAEREALERRRAALADEISRVQALRPGDVADMHAQRDRLGQRVGAIDRILKAETLKAERARLMAANVAASEPQRIANLVRVGEIDTKLAALGVA